MNENYIEIIEADGIEDLRLKLSSLSSERCKELAISSLNTFIGCNFCGLKDVPLSLPPFLSEEAVAQLSFDLNKPFIKVRSLEFLFLAKMATETPSADPLTRFRTALVWQKIIEEPSVQLKEIMNKETADTSSWRLSEDEWAEFFLERADSHLFYYEYEKNEEAIQKALEHAGMEIELAGEMGKRTRWQHKTLAQLSVKTNSVVNGPVEEEKDVPVNVQMNDDTLLESTAFENSELRKRLTGVQLCCVLALQTAERRSTFNDEIMVEKCQAYLEEIISQRRAWSVQASALLCRSELEKTKRRKVERACGQAEHIVKLMDAIDDPTPETAKWSRTRLVLASSLPPWWKCRMIHGEILISLGCVSEALLSYEQLEMWDSVIDCYKALGQLEKAEGLIRRLLVERGEDATLYCCLGDITLNLEYYDKALEISGDRSARAHRALGHILLQRHHYEKAYTHLRRSLELQPIQTGTWFNAGHCAWKTERYAESASCYHRCVSLEPEHFEAWNNLSAAYVRMGQKDRSRRILQEALKFNFEHSNVWTNYLLICIDTNEFKEAIKAYHRLLDLKKPISDDEILEVLVKSVMRLEEECETESPELSFLKEELVKLFGRIVSQQTLSSIGWKCYSALKRPNTDDVVEHEKYIQLLERSVLASTNKPDWSKTETTVKSVLETAVTLSEARLKLGEIKGGEDAKKQANSRIRMSLKPLLVSAEKQFGVDGVDAKDTNISELLREAKQILSTVA